MRAATHAVVADTQILIWYVLDPSRLSDVSCDALQAAVRAQEPIRVSAWSVVKIGYAAEKASNPITEEDRDAVLAVLADPKGPLRSFPWTPPSRPRSTTCPELRTPTQPAGSSSPPPRS